MKTQSTERQNVAQQLLGLLRVPRVKNHGRTILRDPIKQRLIAETMEPRYLLSSEGILLPTNTAPLLAAHELIVSPDALISQQLGLPVSVQTGGTAIQQNADTQVAVVKEVIFVDAGVNNKDDLIQSALQQRANQTQQNNVEVVVLDANSDGVAQISAWLKQHQNLDAVHIISHGHEASLTLGNSTLDAANLDDYATALAGWKNALSAGADLLLYGCDVAEGEQGQFFINQIAGLTGADVAASTDKTGNAALGGDWVLESQTGLIQNKVLEIYPYTAVLAPVVTGDSTVISGTIETNLKAEFAAAAKMGSQANALEALGIILPMADAPFASFFTLNDGRTLGDVLSLRTAKNTSVLDDYLASSGSHTLSGLASYITQYFTGTGVYDGLEALLSDTATTVGSLNSTTGALTLDFTAAGNTLVRQFVSRLTFGDQLSNQGIDWLPGHGVALEAILKYKTTWASTGITVDTLTAQVKRPTDTSLDAKVLVGALEARAVGTVQFETSEVTLAFNGGAALALASVQSQGAIDALNEVSGALFGGDVTPQQLTVTTATPTVKAAADFSLLSTLTGLDFTTLTNATSTDATSNELVITNITSDALTTTSTTPTLTGHVNLANGQQLDLVVGGTTYAGIVVRDATTGAYTTPTVSGVTASYNSSTKEWSVALPAGLSLSAGNNYTVTAKIITTASPATPVATAASTLAVVASLPAEPAAAAPSFNTANPTVNTLTTFSTTPTITGTSPVAYGNALTVKIKNGSGTVLGTYTVGTNSEITYDAKTHVWTLNVPVGLNLTAGTYEVEATVALLPQIHVQYGSGANSISPVATNWSTTGTLGITLSNFDALRKFANIDSVTLANMLKDLGSYLEKLRDSGEFSALLPFTSQTLGSLLDFSAVMNEVVDNQLTSLFSSGVTATSTISPVLTKDVAFDLQILRPGDARTTQVTVTILASETTGFTHIDQLAQLIDKKLATGYAGLLAWTPGDGTVPTGAVAEINTLVQGALAIGHAGVSNERQQVVLHASSGTFTLSLGSATTGPLSVFATAAEVQNALESLTGMGLGSVLVTGTPKHYDIEFVGSKAGTNVDPLTVTFSSDATRGGLLDVFGTNLQRTSDGKVSGRLAIFESVPDSLTTLRVVPSAAIAVQTVTEGATAGTVKTAAVQRITIAYAAGGNITLSGKKADGTTAFTTANISLGLDGAWSTRIQDAINTAMGLNSTTGVTVALTSPSILSTPAGVYSYDITYGGTTVKGLSIETLKAAIPVTDDLTTTPLAPVLAVTSRPGILATTFVLQQAAAAVGSTAAVGEIQRMVLSNVTSSGGFSFGFSSNGRSYESDAVYLTGKTPAEVATAIQTALFSLMKQMDDSLVDPASIVVTAVSTGLSANEYAFDIEYKVQLSGKDVAQLIVNPVGLSLPASTVNYSNISFLGFSPAGQDRQQMSMTTFNSLNDLVARFQQSINDNLGGGVTFSVNPRFDTVTNSFLFDVKFYPSASLKTVPLSVPSVIGDISGLQSSATLDLSAQALLHTTIGFDFSQLNTFSLQSAGAYQGTVAGGAEISATSLVTLTNSGAKFNITLDKDSYQFTLPAGAYTTHAALLTAIQGLLNAKTVTAGGELAARGFANVGEAVKAEWKDSNDKKYLQFKVIASVKQFMVNDEDGTEESPKNYLGFIAPMVGSPIPVSALPTDGKLTANATFSIIVDGTTAVSVTVTSASTSSNSSVSDLVSDINAALNAVSVSGHAYLGSRLGFSNLGQVIQTYLGNGQIQFITQTDKVGSLEVRVSTEKDTASTQLGLVNGQKARTSGTDIFLMNTTIGGDWSAQIHDQVADDARTLTEAGDVSVGLLDLTFNQLSTDYQGSFRFELRKNSTQNTSTNDNVRLSLNGDLFDAVLSQTAQLGMGAAVSTTTNQSVVGVPVLENGQLLRDVGLKVTIAGAGADGADLVLEITVTQASTSSNTSINDLAADVDAAIKAAITAANLTGVTIVGNTTTAASSSLGATESGTSYKASNNFVGVYKFYDDKDTEATTDDATTYHLQFFAPTVTVGSAAAEVKKITIDERLLVENTITPIVFAKNTNSSFSDKSGPTADLTFGGLGLSLPSSLSAQNSVTSGTVLNVKLDNLADVLAGATATTDITVVPPTGLGDLTPLTEISWSDIASQFAELPNVFGSLAGLGEYGELGRLLPILGTDISSLFELGPKLDAIQAGLAQLDGSVIAVVSAAANSSQLAAVKTTEAAAFSISFDDETAYDITLAANSSSTRDGLVVALQAVLSNKAVVAGSSLSKLGYSWVGQAVEVVKDPTTGQIKFVTRAPIQTMTVSAATTSKFVTELGFLPEVTVVPASNRVSLASLPAVLASAFGTENLSLSYDSTAKALRFSVPYVVQLTQSTAIKILFNDEFSQLLSSADRAKLSEMLGTVESITDTALTAPLALSATITLHLDFGIDLDQTNNNPRFGGLFLFDYNDTNNDSNFTTFAGTTNDTGTFATISVTATGTGLGFDNNIGLMNLRVSGGNANLSVKAGLLLDQAQDGKQGNVGRVYLSQGTGSYQSVVDTATAAGASRADIQALTDFRKNYFDVVFDGSASAKLPMNLVLSSDLAQAAISQLEGFVNPMPIGDMELKFADLGASYRAATQQTLNIQMATPSYEGNQLVLGYNGQTATINIASTIATTGIVSNADISTAIAEAVAVLIKGARTGWGSTDWATLVAVNGTRASGFDITLLGTLATDYLAALTPTKTLSVTVYEANGTVLKGSYATPTVSNSVQQIALPTDGVTTVSFAYAGKTTQTVTVQPLGTTGSSVVDTNAEIQAAFKTAVVTLLGCDASKVTVTGDRSGFKVTLSDDVAASFAGQLTVSTETKITVDSVERTIASGTYVRSVVQKSVALSTSVYPPQNIELSMTGSSTPMVVSLGRSDAGLGLVDTKSVKYALADAALKLITSAESFTQTISGIKISLTGETIYFSYRDAKVNLTLGADTTDQSRKIQDAISKLLTGSEDSYALVTVSGTRNDGLNITLTGALAKEHAGEIKVRTADGIKTRYALVEAGGNRATGFNVVLSTSVAAVLGNKTLTATVKDVTASTLVSTIASTTPTIAALTADPTTLVFSYAGKASQLLSVAPTSAGYGVDTDAEIITNIRRAVATLLTGSASLWEGVTVTGTRSTGFAISLAAGGALASSYTGSLTVQVVKHTMATTGTSYTRGNPSLPTSQVLEAYQPTVVSTVNTGTGDTTVDGAPADADNEAALNQTNTNPYSTATGGEGASSSSTQSAAATQATSPSAPTTQPTSVGMGLSYILPDLGHWQDTMMTVLKNAQGSLSCNPDDLAFLPAIFLLRDPTIIVDSLDWIFNALEVTFETAVSGMGRLPLVGDKMNELTKAGAALDFITGIRRDIIGSIRTSLNSVLNLYGGLDNAMRMCMFDALTNDSNGDWIIDATDLASAGYNKYLNFVRDYNGDGVLSPDDIVIEYLIKEDQDIAAYKFPPGVQIDAFDAGQRAFWVTSGFNLPIGQMSDVTVDGTGAEQSHSATLTVQPVNYGGFTLGFTIGSGDEAQIFSTSALEPNASAEEIKSALELALGTANLAYQQMDTSGTTLANTVTVVANLDATTEEPDGTFVITIAGGALAGTFSVTQTCYTTEAGKLVMDSSMEAIVNSAYASMGNLEAKPIGDAIAQMDSGSKTGTGASTEFETTLTVKNQADWGYFRLGFNFVVDGKVQSFETADIARTASATLIQQALEDALANAKSNYADNRNVTIGSLATTVKVTSYKENGAVVPGKFTIKISGGDLPFDSVGGTAQNTGFKVTFTDYTGYNRQLFLESVLSQTSGLQFRMALGQIFSFDLPIDFDIGIDGVPLYMTTTGGLAVDFSWQLLLGFGVDIKDGFFLNANMPNHAGIGSKTTYDASGHATGVEANDSDEIFSFLFAVGKKDLELLKLGMFDALAEHAEMNYYDYLRDTDELIINADFYLKGHKDADGNEVSPFSTEAQLLFLNGKIHDDWSGYVQDMNGAYWGDISKTAKALWVKAERVERTSEAYTSATVKAEDPTLNADGQALYGFILPDDSYVNDSGHTVDDPLYDLDYKDLNETNGDNLFYIDSSGYLRYARDYKVGNPDSADSVQFYKGDHVQQRRTNGVALPSSITPLGPRLFKDGTGIYGSRTHLYFEASIDIHEPGDKADLYGIQEQGVYQDKTNKYNKGTTAGINSNIGQEEGTAENGRLTFSKLKGMKFSEVFEAKAQIRAQINLVFEVGVGIDGSGYLPSIHGGFHMTWGKQWTTGKESDPDTSLLEKFNPSYDKLFQTEKPNIWLTDISLDMGTFVSNFLNPVFGGIQKVIAPFQPVIDVLTKSIPGIDQVMGKPYNILDMASDMSKMFGGDARVEFIIAMVRLAVTITKIPTDAKNLIIPISDVLVLSGDPMATRQFGLSAVKGKLTNIDPSAATAGIPGQTTISLSTGMQNLGAAMKKPGNALKFNVLDDPFNFVVNLLTGRDADIMTFTPPNLKVEVGFRISFPVFPPLYVGIGGLIKVEANLTLGYDTYGITQSIKTGNWLNVFDGFYVSDNVINGIDLPEIILTTRLYVFAELNAGIVRGGVEGGIQFLGTLDLCDPNKDGKLRASEIIAAVKENPLDLISAKIRVSAYIAAYLDVFAIFSYVRVFEYTFMDVTLFTWEFNPCDRNPVLATMDGSVMILNTGSGTVAIDGHEAITYKASDRLRRDTTDGNEKYVLTGAGGSIHIKATLPNGQDYEQDFSGVDKVLGFAGAGNDTFDASAISIPVVFVAGSGTDVLIGGSGNDVLIGGTTGGSSTLKGNGGNDTLIARGGTTKMLGGDGDDTYRFLGDWGTAQMYDGLAVDGIGENTLDFTAQTGAVTLDDAYNNAFRGSNKVTWGTTSAIDLVKGSAYNDKLDFSGREDNLTVSVTGTNAGWVTNSSTGDESISGFSKTSIQTSIGSRGFRFESFENIVGTQGSDVFYIRNGASITGSIYGDTTTGLYHDATTGNENANARNTIDFSDYTTAVVANLEGSSAFGSAGAKNIVVRGMHNIFGGSANDTLTGNHLNNLIVGNGGNDVLDGLNGHDLLVADEFITWTNELSMPSSPTRVKDYVSLEAVGQLGGFGSDGRRWVWLGQTLENKSLTTASQTLKGGGGNDILMGALGGDVFNVGGSWDGNDTIMADLGRIVVDYQYRSALRAYTIGSAGGNDRIYLGSGDNLVLAGAGDDTITGMDSKTSMNIILTDVGDVKFKTTTMAVDGTAGKTTFATNSLSPTNNHMLDYVTTTAVNGSGTNKGGNDSVELVSGSGIVLGGAGNDVIRFSGLASTAANTRWIAGDHATLTTDSNGSVVSFKTDDTVSTTGGADTIVIGQANDANTRYLGANFVLGGMGDDLILVSSDYDATTEITTHGAAYSQDVIIGDNGEITRRSGSVYLSEVKSTVIEKGGNDRIVTANGDKVIVGGFGADDITVSTSSDSRRYMAGDNATLTFDTFGGMTAFASTDQFDYTGGVDRITIRDAGTNSLLGENIIIGGMGADRILVTGTIDPVSGKISAGTAESEDIIIGDSGSVLRTAKATLNDVNRMLQVLSTVTDKGGDDIIATGDGGKVIIGGLGVDTILARDGDNLVFGDNAQLDYDSAAKNGFLRQVQNIDTVLGAADSITLGEGFKIVLGGAAGDNINIIATGLGIAGSLVGTGAVDTRRNDGRDRWVTGIDSVAGLAADDILRLGRSGRYVVGDNAKVTFDNKGGLTAILSSDVISATGGADTITIGQNETSADLGYQVIVGGMGADTITVRASSTSQDIIFGDNVDYQRKSLDYKPLSYTSLTTDKGGDDRIVSGSGVKVVVGGFGADTVTLNTVAATGETAPSNHMILVGDSAALNFDPSGSGYLKTIESLGYNFGGADKFIVGDGDVAFVGGYGADILEVNSNQTAFRVGAGDNAKLTFSQVADEHTRSGSIALASTAAHAPYGPVGAGKLSGLTELVSLDNTSTTGDSDRIRFGNVGATTGNMGIAILMGGMGSDTLTVTGATATNTTLLGDNAKMTRTAGDSGYVTSVLSLLPDQGAGDTLETVSAQNLLVGGQGADVIRAGSGQATVFGDSGQASFGTNGVVTYAASVGTSRGGNDTIDLGGSSTANDGNKVVIGGFGADTITVMSASGTSSSVRERVLAGDNATVTLDEHGRLTAFATQDPESSTGGNDSITLSIVGSYSGGDVATKPIYDYNVLAGGVGQDTLQVFAAVRTHDVMSGDNLDYRRAGSGNNYADLYAETLQGNVGSDDVIRTGSGYKLILGGMGNDRIDTQTVAGDTNIVFGDAGALTYDPNGSGLPLQMASSFTSQGGNDTINLGAGKAYLIGGYGKDKLTINASDVVNRFVFGDSGQINFRILGTEGSTATSEVETAQTTGNSTDDATATVDTMTMPGTGTTFAFGGTGKDSYTGTSSAAVIVPEMGAIQNPENSTNRVVSYYALGSSGEMGVTDPNAVAPADSGTGGTGGTGSSGSGSSGSGSSGSSGSTTIVGKTTGVGAVFEDGSTLIATDRLVYPALSGGYATFAASTQVGTYGTLVLTSDGVWTYTLNNGTNGDGTNPVQVLKKDDVRTDTFRVSTTDGSSTTVTITVTGKADDPTGSLTITETNTPPQQRDVLVLSNQIVDLDGLGTMSYQWLAGGEAISGATGTSLTLTQALVGKTISVRASYTDGKGDASVVTSTATAAVANVNDDPTGVVTISNTTDTGRGTTTAQQNDVLSVSNTLADQDGLGTITYQWYAGGVAIDGATNQTLTLNQAQVGKVITVTARYTDSFSAQEAVSSVATNAVINVNDAPQGVVEISGTVTQNQILTASNTLSDADGLGAVTYQWQVKVNDAWVNVSSDAGQPDKLTVSESQVGKLIRVLASYTDAQGTSESVASSATSEAGNVNDAPQGGVTISGTATQGETLTASNNLTDADGLGTIAYQWYADDVAINGATGTTLTLSQAQVGKAITVKASYTDGHNTAEVVSSTVTTAVANVNDAPQGTVTISGTATQGQTLTASHNLTDADGLGTMTYTWMSGTDTLGTGTTLVLTEAHVGQTITVVASYTDGHNTAEVVTSTATTAVANVNDAPQGGVTISGTATQGETLTASNNLTDADGLGTIAYQWYADDVAIAGATGTTLTLSQAQVGKAITVKASYTDGHNTAEVVSSTVTTAVANVNDPATINGAASGDIAVNETALLEDGADLVNGQYVLTGNLTIVDPDVGEAAFSTTVTASVGALGSLVMNANGTWTYTVNNSAMQSLETGQVHEDRFTVTSADGTASRVMVVKLEGKDEPPVVSNEVLAAVASSLMSPTVGGSLGGNLGGAGTGSAASSTTTTTSSSAGNTGGGNTGGLATRSDGSGTGNNKTESGLSGLGSVVGNPVEANSGLGSTQAERASTTSSTVNVTNASVGDVSGSNKLGATTAPGAQQMGVVSIPTLGSQFVAERMTPVTTPSIGSTSSASLLGMNDIAAARLQPSASGLSMSTNGAQSAGQSTPQSSTPTGNPTEGQAGGQTGGTSGNEPVREAPQGQPANAPSATPESGTPAPAPVAPASPEAALDGLMREVDAFSLVSADVPEQDEQGLLVESATGAMAMMGLAGTTRSRINWTAGWMAAKSSAAKPMSKRSF